MHVHARVFRNDYELWSIRVLQISRSSSMSETGMGTLLVPQGSRPSAVMAPKPTHGAYTVRLCRHRTESLKHRTRLLFLMFTFLCRQHLLKCDLLFHTREDGYHFKTNKTKKWKTTSVGENVKKLASSDIAGGDIKWRSCSGENV